ncbi:MAG TPA: amidase family protein [Candidatus Acidoferrales bacterium]|nr:amidase family protein [Candidatus Acidoferrales bacterium]
MKKSGMGLLATAVCIAGIGVAGIGLAGVGLAGTGAAPLEKARDRGATSERGASRFEVTETTIAATKEAIRTGRVTCRQLVEAYLARIRAYDQSTRLNAIVVVNPKALEDADRLDAEFARTHRLRPLHGIAVIVKDNYDTKGLQTTGGSLAMKGFLPDEDAFMVRKLREAGAIVLAKSNMAEWAFSPYVTMSSIAGTTRNPYDLTRVPAGSSGGTAAAVAASLGEVGLGTDTGNSIRGPSSHNDLVGIRPTIGLTSRDGIIPLFFNNDMGGPMARTVADAAAMLSAVAGYDPADPITKLSEGKAAKDYTAFLDKNGLRGARIGVFRKYVDEPTGDPEVKALTEKAIADLRAQGAEVVDPFVVPKFDELTKDIWCGDFQADLNHYLEVHGKNAPYHSLAEIFASGLYLPYIGEDMKESVNQKAAPGDDACVDVYHHPKKIAFRNAVLGAMDGDKVDAVIYPTWSNAPRKIGDMKSPAGDNSQILSPQTGFPAITVPIGFTHGTLPAGLTLLGRQFSEGELIKYAYAYEQSTRHREPPAKFPALTR